MFNKAVNKTGRGIVASAVFCFIAGAGIAGAPAVIAAPAKTHTVKAVKSSPQAKQVRSVAKSAKKPARVSAVIHPKAAPGSFGARVKAVVAAPARLAALATVPAAGAYQSVLASASALRLELPELKSQAAFVIDMATGMPVLAKNGNHSRPIASITKLMTAMVVLDAGLPMAEKLVVTDDDVDRVKFSSSRLAVGTELSRGAMLNLALMSSENRAAHALGRTYPGGLKAFVSAMNQKAQSLGLKNTKFQDPTGLDARNMASPRDLAHMVAAASKYDAIRSYSTNDQEKVQLTAHAQTFRNTNSLVREGNWDIAVSKTGYIQEAGRCIVMQVVVNSRPTLIVLLNSQDTPSRTKDSLAIKRWLENQETQSTLKAVEILLSSSPLTTEESSNV